MDFKRWLFNEIVDSTIIPKHRGRTIVKDAGTVKSRQVKEYKWKTSLGNEVKLHYEPREEGVYNVMFYVNDTLYDDSSSKFGTNRDPEIFPSIFGMLNKNKVNARQLQFRAWDSEGDKKLIRNLPMEEKKKDVLSHLSLLLNHLNTYQVKMLPITPSKMLLYKRLGRPIPSEVPDFDKDKWIEIVKNLYNKINHNQSVEEEIGSFHSNLSIGKFNNLGFSFEGLLHSMQEYEYTFKSNTPEGWMRTRNRREIIYEKLISKLMPNWKMTKPYPKSFQLDLIA